MTISRLPELEHASHAPFRLVVRYLVDYDLRGSLPESLQLRAYVRR